MIDIFAIPVTEYEENIIPIVIKTRSASITVFDRYINSDFFVIIMKLYSCIKKFKNKDIVNKLVLVNIISDLQIEYDIDKYIFSIVSFICVFKLYFKLIKPKNIFLICYHDLDKLAASYVAKEMNIPVIELQHGMITKAYSAYNTEIDIKPNPYPDYLFCFGEGFKKFVSPFICDQENILIIGNYYIDYVKKNFNESSLLKKYHIINNRMIITVAAQDIFDNKELEFIEAVSDINKDIHFIYVPRSITPKIMHYSHANIAIESELNVYQCMKYSHITSTVCSTCAIESLTFGIPVILINIQNMAKVHYSDFFSPSDAVFYADTPEEYVLCIADALKRDRRQISSDATYYYAENPQERTRQAFEKLNEHLECYK